jgi:hypothetical protein
VLASNILVEGSDITTCLDVSAGFVSLDGYGYGHGHSWGMGGVRVRVFRQR